MGVQSYCVLGTMLPDGCPVAGEGIPVLGEDGEEDVPVIPWVPNPEAPNVLVAPGAPGPAGEVPAGEVPAGAPT